MKMIKEVGKKHFVTSSEPTHLGSRWRFPDYATFCSSLAALRPPRIVHKVGEIILGQRNAPRKPVLGAALFTKSVV
jgi:hypothetical protein